MLNRLVTPLTLALLLTAFPVHADDEIDQREIEEARLQQLFQDGMAAIVEDLNTGSFVRLVSAMDDDDMLERIFGLRLIDQRIKRDFRDRIREGDGFRRFVESLYTDETACAHAC